MATLVRLKHNGMTAVFLGVGYGQFSSATPSALLGNLSPDVKSGTNAMAAISAPDGTIHWHPTENLEVISIDGQSPATLLDASSSSLDS